MPNDPIVIVSAARTPMGAFQGELKGFAAPELGAAAIRAAVERAKRQARGRRGSDHGLRAARRPGPGARAPGRARRRAAARHRLHHRQQDVRLGHEGGDARARPACSPAPTTIMVAGGMESDDQRALPAAEGARRLAHGPRPGARPHVLRRPRGRLRQGPPDGHASPRTAPRSTSSPAKRRTTSRSPRSSARRRPTRTAGSPGRSRRSRSRPARTRSSSRPTSSRSRRTSRRSRTLKPAFRKDGTVTAANSSSISDGAAALVLMRRSTRREARPRAARARSSAMRRTRRSRAGSPPRRSARSASSSRRPAGSASDVDLYEINEAFAVVDDGGDEGARPAARQGQRARRRLRARPSDRRLRRAHPRHADRRAAQVRRQARRRERSASAAARRPPSRWRSRSARRASASLVPP